MTIIAFDNETHPIRPGLQLPPVVCMSWCEVPADATPETAAQAPSWRHGLLTRADALPVMWEWLRGDVQLVGANTAFDVLTICVSAGEHAREFLRLFVEAYEANRIYDVLIRQQLLDLSAGCFRGFARDDGKWINFNYNLADVAWRMIRMQLSKEDETDESGARGPGYWRLRYGELDGLPVAAYPPDAVRYALDDSIAPAGVFVAQRRIPPATQRNFPGLDPLRDEFNQVRAALWLKAMSAYGMRTDCAAVERFRAEVEVEHARLQDFLIREGLVRREFKRDFDGIKAYVTRTGAVRELIAAPAAPGEGGAPAEAKISLAKAGLMRTGDPLLAALADWKTVMAERAVEGDEHSAPGPRLSALIQAGLVRVETTRNTKAAARRLWEAYQRIGRKVPRTDSYKPEVHGDGWECVALDSDACAQSDDPTMVAYSEYTSLAKTLNTDIDKVLMRGVTEPIHTNLQVLLETGRTSSSAPNLQNMRRLPGIRECFIPRPGHVFVDCDYSMLELYTLAQTCLWVLGYSSLADALRNGVDPHLKMAATILGIDYKEAATRREAGDSVVDNARTAGKGANFGRPGGLGVATFTVYAWTNYKIRMTEDEVRTLLQQYDDTWTEMPDYRRWINSLESSPGSGSFNVIQPWSGRLRAGATYCAASNSPFQGLGADVAKLAGWLIFKACHGLSELGEADPLYGCHPVLFVHDSFMTEVPEERAHEAAIRQKELMDHAGRIVLRDVPVKADVVVTRQWSKKAKKIVGPDGRLIPWDIREACRKALVEWLQKGGAPDPREAFAHLAKKEWPKDIARETVAGVLGISEDGLWCDARKRAAEFGQRA